MARMRQLGWYDAAGDNQPPVDANGNPLPWLTLAAIEWLDAVLDPNDTVFEWGSGSSTLWFASRVKSVTSIEDSPEWAEHVSCRLPSNASLRRLPTPGRTEEGDPESAYVQAIRGESPSVVLVDGKARAQCAAAAVAVIGDGLIVLDNSDTYTKARSVLELLPHVDFVGLPPGGALPGCTSVYSRDLLRWLERARPPRTWPANF
jgi:hypothetical protein